MRKRKREKERDADSDLPVGNTRELLFPFESLLTCQRIERTVAINYKRLIFPACSSIIADYVNVTDCVCVDRGGERG